MVRTLERQDDAKGCAQKGAALCVVLLTGRKEQPPGYCFPPFIESDHSLS